METSVQFCQIFPPKDLEKYACAVFFKFSKPTFILFNNLLAGKFGEICTVSPGNKFGKKINGILYEHFRSQKNSKSNPTNFARQK